LDKTKHEAIKDPQRLLEMDWEGKLRRVCDKNDTRFIEYRPETGSWVFRVKHFSKYGLGDSDEEDELPTDPKKAKIATLEAQQRANAEKMTLNSLRQAQKISEDAARNLDPKALVAGVASGFRPMDDTAEFLLMDKTRTSKVHFKRFSFINCNLLNFNSQNFSKLVATPISPCLIHRVNVQRLPVPQLFWLRKW